MSCGEKVIKTDNSVVEFKIEDLSSPKNFDKFGVYLKKGHFPPSVISSIRQHVLAIFEGNYTTGIQPDKIKTATTDSGESYTHSICNGWKSNSYVKDTIVSSGLSKATKDLTGWQTVKLNQDSMFNVVAGSDGVTSFHQDNAYQRWHSSNGGIVTAWVALSTLTPESGGIEYLIGSHLMKSDVKRLSGNFIASKNDPYGELNRRFGGSWMEKYPLYRPELEPGDVIFHHGDLWHGSCPNVSKMNRISISFHLMSGTAKFSGEDISPFFNKFKLDDSDEMNTSFFPFVK